MSMKNLRRLRGQFTWGELTDRCFSVSISTHTPTSNSLYFIIVFIDIIYGLFHIDACTEFEVNTTYRPWNTFCMITLIWCYWEDEGEALWLTMNQYYENELKMDSKATYIFTETNISEISSLDLFFFISDDILILLFLQNKLNLGLVIFFLTSRLYIIAVIEYMHVLDLCNNV